jgi:hypothetical protein
MKTTPKTALPSVPPPRRATRALAMLFLFCAPAAPADLTDCLLVDIDPLMLVAGDETPPPAWLDIRIPKIDISTTDHQQAARQLTELAIEAGAGKHGFKRIEMFPAQEGDEHGKVDLHLRRILLSDAIKYMCQQSGYGYRRLHGIVRIQNWSSEHLSVVELPEKYLKRLLPADRDSLSEQRIAERLRSFGARVQAKDVFIWNNTVSLLCDVFTVELLGPGSEIEYAQALVIIASNRFDAIKNQGTNDQPEGNN